ncbi:peptidyl-prolyl cis-trans isomerase [Massilia sp. B-10]|nr:peptidyl-prolyl cis-trans isomerase [Massilia sp. B-10]
MFQVTPGVSLDLLRTTGEAVLDELKQHPERFAELAGAYSNCVSGKVGGSLGQLAKGQSVPEFDALLFRLAEGELALRLLGNPLRPAHRPGAKEGGGPPAAVRGSEQTDRRDAGKPGAPARHPPVPAHPGGAGRDRGRGTGRGGQSAGAIDDCCQSA